MFYDLQPWGILMSDVVRNDGCHFHPRCFGHARCHKKHWPWFWFMVRPSQCYISKNSGLSSTLTSQLALIWVMPHFYGLAVHNISIESIWSFCCNLMNLDFEQIGIRGIYAHGTHWCFQLVLYVWILHWHLLSCSKGALRPICLLTYMVSKLITLKKIFFFKMKEETVEAPEESE